MRWRISRTPSSPYWLMISPVPGLDDVAQGFDENVREGIVRYGSIIDQGSSGSDDQGREGTKGREGKERGDSRQMANLLRKCTKRHQNAPKCTKCTAKGTFLNPCFRLPVQLQSF
jgi:hypothetical protein